MPVSVSALSGQKQVRLDISAVPRDLVYDNRNPQETFRARQYITEPLRSETYPEYQRYIAVDLYYWRLLPWFKALSTGAWFKLNS